MFPQLQMLSLLLALSLLLGGVLLLLGATFLLLLGQQLLLLHSHLSSGQGPLPHQLPPPADGLLVHLVIVVALTVLAVLLGLGLHDVVLGVHGVVLLLNLHLLHNLGLLDPPSPPQPLPPGLLVLVRLLVFLLPQPRLQQTSDPRGR